MNWQELCEHPNLQNLPFKIELNEKGKVLMSPVKVYHAAYQAEISYLLRSLLKAGRALAECAIKTRLGTKVADVAWASQERFERIKHETECSVAPEICIEIWSSSNTADEIEEKINLYLESGAKEVWVCERNGDIDFYDLAGKQEHSALFPAFPSKIDL
ncbi:MAG: Uma2 family endonuclease [Candidatus Poribacteria bacterium]|nr:Uma2 family endonuclease [Candidatus Poribacteria bacterium]